MNQVIFWHTTLLFMQKLSMKSLNLPQFTGFKLFIQQSLSFALSWRNNGLIFYDAYVVYTIHRRLSEVGQIPPLQLRPVMTALDKRYERRDQAKNQHLSTIVTSSSISLHLVNAFCNALIVKAQIILAKPPATKALQNHLCGSIKRALS